MSFDEADLIRRIGEFDQSALSELYQRFGGLVYSIALHVVQNSTLAEEITQDTFLKLWRYPSRWDPQRGRFASWLVAITRYTAIDRLRREQRRPLQNAIEWDDTRLGTDALVDDATWQETRNLHTLMARLPEEQEQVLELAFFQGMTHSEMAQYLGLPLGTVKTRVRLGLQKLKYYSAQSIYG